VIDIKIGRLNIALHGVSAQVVEAAVVGLEEEMRRRMGALALGDVAAFDVGELSIGPVRRTGVLDAASLRGIIAERMIEAVQSGLTGSARRI